MGFFYAIFLPIFEIWMKNKIKIVLAWFVLVIFGLPLLLTLFGINFFALLGIVAIGFAIKVLYDNHKGRL